MCGRFSLHLTDLSAVAAALGISLPTDASLPLWEPRYNVAPTQQSPVAIGGTDPELAMARWGLVPHWARDLGAGAHAINARVETASSKPTFRDGWRGHHCVVPATGYFEWKKLDGKRRAPMWIHPSSAPIMRLAGLWSDWRAPDGGAVRTFTILTQPARDFVADIHDRMPVELSAAGAAAWLAPGRGEAQAQQALDTGTMGTRHLEARPVSDAVGNPRNDVPACIEVATAQEARRQLTFDELFGSDT